MAGTSLIAFLALIAAPATNSGLIVFLPLVAAFVGAIIGAWANSWYRNREAKKAEDQERRGLISLISAEVGSNDSFLSTMKMLRTASQLDTSAWDQAQARLSGLLPLEEITLIANPMCKFSR